jgi:prepilin-type N-terminal cleavage/methylation domain-containing protein
MRNTNTRAGRNRALPVGAESRCRACPRLPRRPGFTMVEMLVAVALLVLMMTIVAAIFGSATSAITISRTYQELDGSLQQISSTLRQDLGGVTANTTPPINPDDNLGYIEYGENQFADLQGEDSDDYLRFTTKAPEGQLFSGRFYVMPTQQQITFMQSNPTAFALYLQTQPITIYSQFAEIIYFVRNGNLYRRVLLVVPERQASASQGMLQLTSPPSSTVGTFLSPAFSNILLGWMGVNDISATPHYNPNGGLLNHLSPHFNTLGDLTNRHMRAFSPRFTDDYFGGAGNTPDGVADDMNGDAVPDLYPTLYPLVFGTGLINPNIDPFNTGVPTAPHTLDTLAFPFIFPGAFSAPDPSAATAGMLHGLGPSGDPIVNGAIVANPYPPPYGHFFINGNAFTASAANPAYRPNHNPLLTGDTLATPAMVATPPLQTWWGFPTWRETASPFWADPVYAINFPGNAYTQAPGLSWTNRLNGNGYLPPLNDPNLDVQPFTDNVPVAAALTAANPFGMPYSVYRDDLILQGVRSFDVKIYDDSVPGYVDLGYSNYVLGITASDTIPAGFGNAAGFAQAVLATMGHEGRIPPLPTDYRSDPNSGLAIGDSQNSVLRLRRVWDSWSTDYSNAPSIGINKLGFPIGPPFSQPVYPSYPAPYPAPMRGLQIQIRVTDPRNERIKAITIRQDFSDKL